MELVACHPEIDDDLKEQLEIKQREAVKLSETRNIVAHSRSMMKIYEHPKEGWAHHEIGIGNVRNKDNTITLELSRATTDQAESLAKDLYDIYDRIYERANNRNGA